MGGISLVVEFHREGSETEAMIVNRPLFIHDMLSKLIKYGCSVYLRLNTQHPSEQIYIVILLNL